MKNKLIGVVGVSENPDKFEYKIFLDLLAADFKVVAVVAHGGKVAGKTAYKSLRYFPIKSDIV